MDDVTECVPIHITSHLNAGWSNDMRNEQVTQTHSLSHKYHMIAHNCSQTRTQMNGTDTHTNVHTNKQYTQALCDARAVPGLIAFAGAYHLPDSGQIAIVLEYMDGGSLQVCCCFVCLSDCDRIKLKVLTCLHKEAAHELPAFTSYSSMCIHSFRGCSALNKHSRACL